MKFTLEHGGGYRIHSYDHGLVRIATPTAQQDTPNGITEIRSSVIISSKQLVTQWTAQEVADLAQSHLDLVLALSPEVILLGTGPRLVFPPPHLMQYCLMRGVGFEVMDNPAACRTYNILAAEGRAVAVALLIKEGTD